MLFKAFLRKEFNFIFFFILSPSHLILNIQWGLLIFLPYKKIICMYLSFFCCLFLFIFNICVNKYRTVPLFGIYILNLSVSIFILMSIYVSIIITIPSFVLLKKCLWLWIWLYLQIYDLFEPCIYSVFP